ncbi:uncharacterized protein LOC129730410 [Wyeomyia smithii]|uniref:uncharacterized protein LOC129730410 n=1 Tax=Wyeomyia smithii TaxID=174621 RepID=UPI002467D859|nr:uncharacterized protein LOC129730410 [Wyeomyia smithii]
MGLCSSCFKSAETETLSPSAEVRRQQQLEAAERRRIQNETRGIKNPEKVMRMQYRAQEIEKREEEAARIGGGQPSLRWQQD